MFDNNDSERHITSTGNPENTSITLRNVARHSIVYAVGDFITKGIGFLLLPIYTRYLVPEQYGTLELLDLVSYIAGFVVAMGISQAMSRFYQDGKDDLEREDVISSALCAVVTTCVIFLCLALPLTQTISRLVFSSETFAQSIRIVFLTLTLSLILEIPMTVLRLRQKSTYYVAINLSRTLVTISLSILFVVRQHRGVDGVLFASNLSSCLFASVLVVWLLKTIRFRFRWKALRPMLGYGLPLVGSWAGAYVMNFADRFFLQRMANLDSVGVYAVAYKFGMLPNLLILAPFLMVWSTRQFEISRRADHSWVFTTAFEYLLLGELYLALLIAVPIEEVLRILVAPNYLPAAELVPIILLSYVFYGAYSFSQFGLLHSKETGLLSWLVLGCAALNLCFNLLFIPRFEAKGAAMATLCSFTALALIVGVVSQRRFSIRYDVRRILHLTGGAAAVFFVSRFINTEYNILNLVVKFVLAGLYPLVLFSLGFFRREELNTLWSFVNLKRGSGPVS